MENNPKKPTGNPGNSGNSGNPQNDGKKARNIWLPLVITVILVLIISHVYNLVLDSQYEEKTFSDFLAEMEAGTLHEVEIHPDRIYYLTK